MSDSMFRLMSKSPMALVLLSVACGPVMNQEATSEEKTIYGVDDRSEYRDFAPNTKQRRWMDATPVLAHASDVICSGPDCSLFLDVPFTYCAGVTFAFPPQARLNISCTAALVGPNLAITAAHCFQDSQDPTKTPADVCHLTKVVFDYVADAQEASPLTVPSTSVFNCLDIVASGTPFAADGVDWAVFRLDGVPKKRAPLPVRRRPRIADGTLLSTAGYPNGTPMKFSEFGEVTSNPTGATTEFEFNLEGFSGNSGGPILLADVGRMEGVYNAGQQDWIFDNAHGCISPKVCDETSGCPGFETATRIELASAAIPLNPAETIAAVSPTIL